MTSSIKALILAALLAVGCGLPCPKSPQEAVAVVQDACRYAPETLAASCKLARLSPVCGPQVDAVCQVIEANSSHVDVACKLLASYQTP